MLIKIFYTALNFVFNNKWTKSILTFSLIAYFIAFLIIYYKYGISAIGLHTNVILPMCIIILCSYLLIKNHNIFLIKKIQYYTSIYLIIEILIIIISPNKISNHLGIQYNGYDKNPNQAYYHIRKSNSKYQLKSSEYNFSRNSNSIGISDKEIEKIKPQNTIRILCLGDSFTEGDGTHNDSTYVKFLERELNKKKQNLEFINAGRCGSDPFHDFELLKDILIEYQPDIILQSFTTNDFYQDFIIKGGKDRFNSNKSLSYKNEYWWEPLYAASYTLRVLIQSIGGYDKNLIKIKKIESLQEEMYQKTIELFKEYNSFTQKNDIDLILFTIPFKNDWNKRYNQNQQFHQMFQKEFSKFGLDFYNLENCYNEYIENTKLTYRDFYWKKDGHHNAQGYEMMAHCIEDILTPYLDKTNK